MNTRQNGGAMLASPRNPSGRRIARPAMLLACALLLGTGLARRATAVDLPPAVDLLPDETVAVLRIPSGQAFVEALRGQTRLGQLVFSPKLLDEVQKIIFAATESPDAEGPLPLFLRRDWKPGDVAALFQRDLGYAVLMVPRQQRTPGAVGLFWIEPGEELAARILTNLQAVAGEMAESDTPLRRVDLDLAGHQVMHLSMVVSEQEQVELDVPDDAEELTEEQWQQLFEERQRKQEQMPEIDVDQLHFFAARIGGRLLVAHTFLQNSTEVKAAIADTGGADLAAMTGLEEATGIFARFLTAHSSPATAGRPALLDLGPLAAELPGGVPLVDAAFDPRPLFKLLESVDLPAGLMASLGADGLGPAALRVALEGNRLRAAVVLSAPAPRRGLVALLDQAPLTPRPPDWVPSSVDQFQQISFDLGGLYAQIKQLAIEHGGEEARAQYEVIDNQVRATIQTDLATALSSIGNVHTMLAFPSKAGDAEPEETDEFQEEFELSFNERVGMVWQVRDEQLWRRLMQMLVGMAPLTGGNLQPADEQGFSGVRFQGFIEGGVFFGNGSLVVGLGSDVVERLLASLRNPPTGADALVNSELFARAQALHPLGPCLAYSLSDSRHTAQQLRDALVQAMQAPTTTLESIAEESEDAEVATLIADQKARIERLKDLLPEDSQLEGLLGIGVGMTTVDGRGMISHSVLELPAP